MLSLDPATTALVLIDLQKGILALPLAPRTGSQVLETGLALADRFRAAGALVVRIRVAWAPDMADAPSQAVDQPMRRPPEGLPPGFADYPDAPLPAGDLSVTKRHWGAFHGTELDLQLRRRGIRTVVLGGVATNLGVESTARSAWEYGYDVVVAEDATTSLSAEMHAFSIGQILPRISRVVAGADLRLG